MNFNELMYVGSHLYHISIEDDLVRGQVTNDHNCAENQGRKNELIQEQGKPCWDNWSDAIVKNVKIVGFCFALGLDKFFVETLNAFLL